MFDFIFILAPYCSSYPRILKRTLNGNQFFSLKFSTRSFPCVTELRSIFYPNPPAIAGRGGARRGTELK